MKLFSAIGYAFLSATMIVGILSGISMLLHGFIYLVPLIFSSLSPGEMTIVMIGGTIWTILFVSFMIFFDN